MEDLQSYIERGIRIIQQARKQRRLSFQESVRANGMDDRSLLKLDDITHTHNDENEVKAAHSIHEIDMILRRYE